MDLSIAMLNYQRVMGGAHEFMGGLCGAHEFSTYRYGAHTVGT